MANPKLFRVIDHGVAEYRMIEEGDRILIGASGGKDSTALVEYFGSRLLRKGDKKFSVTALHIATEIGSPLSPELAERVSEWGGSPQTLEISVLGRLKSGHSMNCWWCSTQRRTELNEFAIREGYNKIALGHHLDDILETALMNALGKGELSTMPPRLKYDKYPVTIIRPLCFADIPMIVNHATERGYIMSTCTCTYQDNSGRKDARRRLEALTDGRYGDKLRLFEALRNIRTDYLP
jgi:tRNA 2-thiocytidine biosynthesis protein TtcA